MPAPVEATCGDEGGYRWLEDPEGVYGANETIYWFSRGDSASDDPWLTEVLNAWKMDDDTLGGLMATIEEVGDPVEGAQQWIDNHRDIIERWAPIPR